MAVKLRLARRGSKKRPVYHIIAADERDRRDGRFLQQVGLYDPRGNSLAVNEEVAGKWLQRGAQMTPTVKKLLKRAGVPTARVAATAEA